jgi:alkylated DNA repair dioxygenase AlkB
MTVQLSLLDEAGDGDGDYVPPLDGRLERTTLTAGAWVDTCAGWLPGTGDLFDALVDLVPWRAERRQMYERIVDVPRLVSFYGEGEALPHPLLDQALDQLNRYYGPVLGEPLVTAGLCLYRDGHDSVAWHGDTIGRSRTEDTMVAIVSFGNPRRLMLRPRGGGQSIGFALGHGDLIVMGGSCQRTWEHAILKTARPAGPRISVQFRPHGVR